MRKKYLSALLFGAILFTPAVTFTSCSDYDDDIASLQSQITSLESSISTLQSQVDAGNYVTAVSGSGADITFTFSDGSTTTITVDNGSEAQIVTISDDGELLIDGEGTGIFASTENAGSSDEVSTVEEGVVKVQDGTWWVLGEDGEYADTGIPVSSVTVVGNDEEGYTLTIYAADGTTQEIFVAGAASLITSIDVESGYPTLDIIKATFSAPSSWAGPKTLPSDGSVIYSSNSDIPVRINPVDAPATEVTYTLVNSNNQELSNIELTATADNTLLTVGDQSSRAAGTSNGLYVLNMGTFTLTKDAASTFEDELSSKGNVSNGVNRDNVVFAVNANVSTRSNYAVTLTLNDAVDLRAIEVSEIENSVVRLEGSNTITVTVGETYTIDVAEGEGGSLYDMWFEFDSGDIKTYDITYDNEARTFTVGTDPDLSTKASGFEVTVHTLDTNGNVSEATYEVRLNSDIINTDYTYAGITYDISQLTNSSTSDDGFTIDLTEFKAGLGDSETLWINRVNIDNTIYALYDDASCDDDDLVTSSLTALTFENYQADGTTLATNANNLQNIGVTVVLDNSDNLTLDTQYYLKVTFVNENNSTVNSIVVPVTFTAPSLETFFSVKDGYVKDGVIYAYFDVDGKHIRLDKYFSTDLSSLSGVVYELDDETVVYTSGNTNYTTSEVVTINDYRELKFVSTYKSGDESQFEVGYGVDLVINATKDNYEGWKYADEEDGIYTFEIKMMSPIAEGTVYVVDGSSVEISANDLVNGANITSADIMGADYNGNTYNVVPDEYANGAFAWSDPQIGNVTLLPDEDGYIKEVGRVAATEDGEGYFTVKGNSLSNRTEVDLPITVTDVWGYTVTVDIPVTILVN